MYLHMELCAYIFALNIHTTNKHTYILAHKHTHIHTILLINILTYMHINILIYIYTYIYLYYTTSDINNM